MLGVKTLAEPKRSRCNAFPHFRAASARDLLLFKHVVIEPIKERWAATRFTIARGVECEINAGETAGHLGRQVARLAGRERVLRCLADCVAECVGMWIRTDRERCGSISKRLTRDLCGKAADPPTYGDVALAVLLGHEQIVMMLGIHPDCQPGLLTICDWYEIKQCPHFVNCIVASIQSDLAIPTPMMT